MDNKQLTEFLNKLLSTQTNKLIILNNINYHKSKIVKDLIRLNNNLLYTISYSLPNSNY